jgi:AraC-like DNA-binding protein
MDNFVITEFIGAMLSKDPKGRKFVYNNRPYACFIVTYKGRVKFTSKYGIVVADSEHSVFLPQGLSYVNECEDDAESYVFNFLTQSKYDEPLSLNALGKSEIDLIFNNIKRESDRRIVTSNNVGVFAEIYLLAKKLFLENFNQNDIHPLVKKALLYMNENYSNNLITMQDVAEKCYVSEVYLRKLFDKYLNETPFKILTKIRMEKAKFMIEEKRPIIEIALNVGYSDIYQFSRAYKKFYGYSPSTTKNTYTPKI